MIKSLWKRKKLATVSEKYKKKKKIPNVIRSTFCSDSNLAEGDSHL